MMFPTVLVIAVLNTSTIAGQPAAPSTNTEEKKLFRAGAGIVDITPTDLPVISSGSFIERMADTVNDPLYARSLVFDDGSERATIAVVDNLMIPRTLADQAKTIAHQRTGIPAHRILISATHTHRAPSVMGALGSGTEEEYARLLLRRIAQAIELAVDNLAPAKVGWAVVDDLEHTHCRRWIRRPDKIDIDPFGERTVRAMMHPGYQNPQYIGPAGPVDPQLSILAVQSLNGRPIGLLANYSMHYFGQQKNVISADYFGLFNKMIEQRLGAQGLDPPFVGIMSQGTSGDLHWMDYSQPRKPINIDTYAQEVTEIAYQAYKTITYRKWVPIAMAETILKLKRRTPDETRLTWAKKIADEMKGRKPKTRPEVYALEQIYLKDHPTCQIKLQALRLGQLGITAIPCEVYGITGLKIKTQSPLEPTFNISLANGGQGYIPPPEQHFLGGYTTWPARSACLEVQAEPKIVEAVLELLEKISSKSRREPVAPAGPYSKAVINSKPIAYWRFSNLAGPSLVDFTSHGNHGIYENGIAFYLNGPQSNAFCGQGHINRAAHFAGGRTKAVLKQLGSQYSIEMWFWNGLPTQARAVTGYLFSRGVNGAAGAPGDHLGIGGIAKQTDAPGKLFFYNGDALNQVLPGKTDIALRTWNHVVLIHDGFNVTVYLNGHSTPEIAGQAAAGSPPDTGQIFIGGRNDHRFNFEGKIDEVAVYNRILAPQEIASHYAASQIKVR
jgi:hypothetical protein